MHSRIAIQPNSQITELRLDSFALIGLLRRRQHQSSRAFQALNFGRQLLDRVKAKDHSSGQRVVHEVHDGSAGRQQ